MQDHAPSHLDAPDEAHEAAGRRLLGVEAVWLAGVGVALLTAAAPLARQLRLPTAAVGGAGLVTVLGSAAVGVSSLGEDWQAASRPVVLANGVAFAGLTGLAISRGSRLGRIVALGIGVPMGVLASRQIDVLLKAQGPVIA